MSNPDAKLCALLITAICVLPPFSRASGATPNQNQKSSLNMPSTSSRAGTAAAQQEDGVRDVLMQLEAAINSRDAHKAAALFDANAIFIDDSGEETEGQKAITDRLSQLSQDSSAGNVGIHPERINFPDKDVALVVGTVSRKRSSQDLPATRFSLVLIKKQESWTITQASEHQLQSTQTENNLQDLSWLIGTWKVSSPGSSAQLTVEWSPNKKFIVSKSIIVKPDNQEPQIDSQVIGWNPQTRKLVSWHFDNNGGFGSGVWSKPDQDQNLWTVSVSGIGADGSTTHATNIFDMKSKDEFTWQSVQRTVDGTAVNDSEALTVVRAEGSARQ